LGDGKRGGADGRQVVKTIKKGGYAAAAPLN
jgi:hypothetical protein